MYLLSATGILKEFQGEPLTSPLTFNIDENEKLPSSAAMDVENPRLLKCLSEN